MSRYRVVLCSNAETLGIQPEDVADVVGPVSDSVIDAGNLCELDSWFANWHGGIRTQFGHARTYGVVVYLIDDDGQTRHVRSVTADESAAAKQYAFALSDALSRNIAAAQADCALDRD